MFIHIGNNIIISDKNCIGIFNTETLKNSSDNNWLIKDISDEDKLVVLESGNRITGSGVSPFTVIKRESVQKEELIWSRENDKKLQR